ncbi:MAG: glycosyl transferase family 2 [Spirochaetes bacterium GWF1_41_5]|nr:MAG: glycosyl transferase family 2 [Spirochaetes bacterium GWF1_41_5]HBE03678.1 glycosyltransferase [Spirochaetia bacterium]
MPVKPYISICIPVYNSENTIAELVRQIKKNLDSSCRLEFILVNDCSRDQSEKICTELSRNYKNVVFISLRKNFGEHNAVMCALNHAGGEYAVIIDDDFQNPPEEIIKLVREAQKGWDVVYSKYNIKKHNILRNIGSAFNDKVFNWLIGKPRHLYLSSFKVINKEVVNEIIKYKGPFPYIDGLIFRITRNVASVAVEHHDRKAGVSNYTFSKLVSLWLAMFVNFSIKPLRLAVFFGFFTAFCGFFSSFFLVFRQIFFHINDIPGWLSLYTATLLFSGLQLIFLGLLGEYTGKIYLDQNGTPQWVIKKTCNYKQRKAA